MPRSKAIVLTVIIALMTAIGPMVAAVFVAQRQGLNLELERVRAYAREVLYRSDRAVQQMREAIDLMQAAGLQEPCSDEMHSLLLSTGLEMQYIIAVGYIEGNIVYCSTLGQHPDGFDLGPPDMVAPSGSGVRMDIDFAFLDGAQILAMQRGNYVAMAHRTQAVDIAIEEDGAILATFTPGMGIRTALGEPDPRWVDRLAGQREAVFVDDDYIVAVALSADIASTGAIAAIPRRFLNERVLEFAIFLLPIGLLTALILTFAVLYLARQQMSLSSEIRMALRRRQFFLVYQPIVELDTGRWVGAEALVRWRRADGQLIGPDAFIPIAEQSDLINDLTAEILSLAARDMAPLLRAYPDFNLAVNLSAADLQSQNSLDQLQRLLQLTGSRPGQLTVELTERMLLDPETARANVSRVRQMGIQVAIDDFGTGYSSLSYLETMQFDSLKIDKLFVEAIGTDAATNRVVLHIIEMARTLGLKIVAEGVETSAQAEFLASHGVSCAQGWHFGYPLDASRFAAELQRQLGEPL